ncbi:MAG: hypothetical protein ABEJ42_04705 [Halobacteriaceae archaeon]
MTDTRVAPDRDVPDSDPDAAETFALLANETRVDVLLALWDAHDPGEETSPLSFSALFDRVDYDDAGNFSYHLERLTGQFVRRTADGYVIRDTGLSVVRSVVAGTGIQDASLSPTTVDRACPLCGAPTTVSYDDGVLYQACTDCAGVVDREHLPEGYLNSFPLDPAGLTGRSAGELLEAAEIAAYRHVRSMFEGLCSSCSGPVDASLEACADHAADGVCERCGHEPAVTARFRCRVCRDFHGTTPAAVCVVHPSVVAFLADHGVAPHWHAADADGLAPIREADPTFETDVVARDPLRAAVTVRLRGDELRCTFDGTVSVVDVSRGPPAGAERFD